ncbi:hypothetical protein CC78DRAFT_579709 [Lojkania enalia]|uniref:Uncharacterized protein n=1 Tax=Lojkania enalia TaxID=147567 RepID=A0A9P4K960_9PLEO|nr:hypothetical protein CC78DRAFT_579709 [Didymosphaeria enalia]
MRQLGGFSMESEDGFLGKGDVKKSREKGEEADVQTALADGNGVLERFEERQRHELDVMDGSTLLSFQNERECHFLGNEGYKRAGEMGVQEDIVVTRKLRFPTKEPVVDRLMWQLWNPYEQYREVRFG